MSDPSPPRSLWGRVLVGLLLALALIVGALAALGVEIPGRQAIADDPRSAETATLEEVFDAHDALFSRFVRDDGVDWAGMAADAASVRALAALYARSGPQAGSLGAATAEGALAFRMNAYNALVALGVVEHWPIASVHDVHGVIDPRPGFGFFYAQLFVLDRGLTNLYDLENVIRRSGDARIHAAIHCASRGCPALSPTAYRPETVDAQLEQAAQRFTADPQKVRVDHEARVVELSSLFDWYRTDFEQHARTEGELPGVLAWIRRHSLPRVRAEIERADREGYAIRYVPYDWALSSPR
ncbi:MAG: hypothetical protein OHK0013_26610 [Sandaracinaceae bacterium]